MTDLEIIASGTITDRLFSIQLAAVTEAREIRSAYFDTARVSGPVRTWIAPTAGPLLFKTGEYVPKPWNEETVDCLRDVIRRLRIAIEDCERALHDAEQEISEESELDDQPTLQ